MEINTLIPAHNKTPNTRKSQDINLRRAYFLLIIFALVGFGFVLRFFYLGVLKHDNYSELAQRNKNRITWKVAKRGIIYDRDHNQLVYNEPYFSLVVDTQYLPPEEERSSLARDLAEITEKKVEEIERKFTEGGKMYYQSLVLKQNLSRQEAVSLKSKFSDLKAVRVVEATERYYPHGQITSHVLGYTSEPTKEEVEERGDVLSLDQVGRTGIEKSYDDFLQGLPGKKIVEVDSLGRKVRTLDNINPEPGNNVVLTLDLELQKTLYEVMAEILTERDLRSAAAVAMDPRTGGVLGMVSFPSYDNNKFSENYAQLAQDPDYPLLNRSISGTYPPGSCFKPVVALGALEEGLIDAEKKINCKGGITVGSSVFKDWKTHGPTDLKKAIAQSCNVYFYSVGGGYGSQQALGVDRINSYAKNLGLGQKTGIDISNESSGLIPSTAWKEEIIGEKWYRGDTYNTSIGQGFVRTTPLQIAVMTSFFANRGQIVEPHFLDRVMASEDQVVETYKPDELPSFNVERASINAVRDGMRETILSGTAEYLKGAPVDVAGKTGTAQYGTEGKEHGWLTSFAPYENPEIVLTVVIEAGAGQGGLPTIFTRRVYARYFD